MATKYYNPITISEAKTILANLQQVFIKIDGVEYKVSRIFKNTFTYGFCKVIANITDDTKFYTKNSQTYTI